MKTRQLAVILGLVTLLTLTSLALFYYGRQHKIIIDNRSAKLADGRTLRALPGARVAVDHDSHKGTDPAPDPLAPPPPKPLITFRFAPPPDESALQAVEMTARERIMVKVVGPKFNLKVAVKDKWGETAKTIEVDVPIGMRRDAMIRLVKLAEGLDYLEDFPDQTIRRPAEPNPAATSETAPPPLEAVPNDI